MNRQMVLSGAVFIAAISLHVNEDILKQSDEVCTIFFTPVLLLFSWRALIALVRIEVVMCARIRKRNRNRQSRHQRAGFVHYGKWQSQAVFIDLNKKLSGVIVLNMKFH